LAQGPAAINSLMPLFSQQGYQSFRKTVRTEVTLGSNRITANEGETVVLTLNTRNVRTGTEFYYTVTGIAQEDLSAGSLSGTATVISGSATITFTLADDVTFLEGPETLTVTLYRIVGGITGGVPLGLQPITGVDPISVPVEDTSRIVPGETVFTAGSSTTTFTWTVPEGVTSISMVCVGSGGRGSTWRNGIYWRAGSGGGGGGLGYRNNVTVTPGEVLTITVGQHMSQQDQTQNRDSTVKRANGTLLCAGYGGLNAPYNTRNRSTDLLGGGYFGDGGGHGGWGGINGTYNGSGGGGGGAGGYSGNGGSGGPNGTSPSGTRGRSGTGGGGAGGNSGTGVNNQAAGGGGGGGVGIYGEGNAGIATSTQYAGGRGGSGGNSGSARSYGRAGAGAFNYGGGGGGGTGGSTTTGDTLGSGGRGAVRIIWPGDRRRFPSTNVGEL
jgi:hypothetical protein